MIISICFENKPLFFSRPVSIISCYDYPSFSAAFSLMERALSEGYHLAGFFSYEAGHCFEGRLKEDKTYDFPLVYFGVYKPPLRAVPRLAHKPESGGVGDIRFSVPRHKYSAHIETIRGHIARGEVYQVTYCNKLLFSFSGEPYALYRGLLKQQPVPYPAYIDTGEFQILSCSPEMFIRKKSKHIVTKPMKGTWPRGRNPVDDWFAYRSFSRDEKNRAENVMIADLLRNDLGKIGRQIGAGELFKITGYKTLYQMTSLVRGKIDSEILLYALFAALFPSGSVTGAPKISAMKIIKHLEPEERRIYTGAIGYITPERDMFFNVPIRTLLLRGNCGEMGIGGGIVWDSTPGGEWEESRLKSKFLMEF
jgi:para-aminobenzoate synthetase/4-amino-4-deoxychorismate lyase